MLIVAKIKPIFYYIGDKQELLDRGKRSSLFCFSVSDK
jgi:hypothetical protein